MYAVRSFCQEAASAVWWSVVGHAVLLHATAHCRGALVSETKNIRHQERFAEFSRTVTPGSIALGVRFVRGNALNSDHERNCKYDRNEWEPEELRYTLHECITRLHGQHCAELEVGLDIGTVAPHWPQLIAAHQSHLVFDMRTPSFGPVPVAEQSFSLRARLRELDHCKPRVAMDWLGHTVLAIPMMRW